RRHAAADDRSKDLAGVEVLRPVRQTLEAEHDLRFHEIAHLARVATLIVRHDRDRSGRGGEFAETVGGHGDEPVMVDGAGGGDDLATDRFDLAGNVGGGTGARAFEGHVLEKVRQAVLVLLLRARAGADPDAQGSALQVLHGVGDDSQSRFQARYAYRHSQTFS